MRSAILATMLVVLMSATMPVEAIDKDGAFIGLVGESCGKYMADHEGDGRPYVGHYGWVAGYLTAYNQRTPDTYNILGNSDMSSVMLWLDNYCKANPLSNIVDAMWKLTDELHPKRHRTAKDAGR